MAGLGTNRTIGAQEEVFGRLLFVPGIVFPRFFLFFFLFISSFIRQSVSHTIEFDFFDPVAVRCDHWGPPRLPHLHTCSLRISFSLLESNLPPTPPYAETGNCPRRTFPPRVTRQGCASRQPPAPCNRKPVLEGDACIEITTWACIASSPHFDRPPPPPPAAGRHFKSHASTGCRHIHWNWSMM
jgi:hypothetical protein